MNFARFFRVFVVGFVLFCVLPLLLSSWINARTERHHGISVVAGHNSRRLPGFDQAFAALANEKAGGHSIKTFIRVKENETPHLVSKHRLRTILINGEKRNDVFVKPWTIDPTPLSAGLVPVEIKIPRAKEEFQGALLWTKDYVKLEAIPVERLYVEPVKSSELFWTEAGIWLGIIGRLSLLLGALVIVLFVLLRKSSVPLRPTAVRVVFLIVLAFIFYVRFNGIEYQLTEGLHPDERAAQKNAAVYRMGQLHPRSFLYSPGFHYLTALLDVTLSWVMGHSIPPHLAARILSAAFSSLTCVLVFSIAKTLFSPLHGLVAMFFLGFAYMPMLIAHSGIIEPTMVFFFVLAVQLMLRATAESPLKTFFMSGLAAGAAIGIKQTSVFIVIPFVSMWIWLFRERMFSGFAFWRAIVWGGGIVVAYFVLSPFSLIDFRNFYLDNLYQVRAVSGGIITAEFFRGVPSGPGLILDYLRDGMGMLMLIAAAGGCLFIVKQSPRGAVLMVPFCIIYFIICSLVRTPPYHYPLLLCPFLAILAACSILELRRLRYGNTLAAIAIAAAVYPSLTKTIKLQRILDGTDNREKAVVWCYQHLPADTRIDYEFFGPRFLIPAFRTDMIKLFFRGKFEDYFRSNRAAYYIQDSSTSGLFLRGGEKVFPVENEWYRLLPSNADLVQEFSGDTIGLFNPQIKIYRLHDELKVR